MGAPALVLSQRNTPVALPLRLLHGWHLLSLDAPTVAFCWLLLFAETMHIPHALPQALALACAVWLVYAADRLLDARHAAVQAWFGIAPSRLSLLYREHAPAVLLTGTLIAVTTLGLLLMVPRALAEAWLLLTMPLAGYAAAVHVLRLQGQWKAVCVGIFFAVAVALPAEVHAGGGWPLLIAALAFGTTCYTNCAVLYGGVRQVRCMLCVSLFASLAAMTTADERPVAFACAATVALLAWLSHRRQPLQARTDGLTWRALVDGALVVPPVAVAIAMRLTR